MIVQFDSCFPETLDNLPNAVKKEIIPILRQIREKLQGANSVLELSSLFDVTNESPRKLKEIIKGSADFCSEDKFYSVILIPDYYLYLSVFGKTIPVCFMCGIGHFEKNR